MALTKKQQALIIEAVNKAVVGGLVCPVSKDQVWAVEPAFIMPDAQDDPSQRRVGGPSGYPFAVVTCETCGYTIFFNIMKLGVGEQLGFTATTERQDED